jgi:hypothetical protein
MIDYRQLLVKYITHVCIEEGISFLDRGRINEQLFTPEEQSELVLLDKESVELEKRIKDEEMARWVAKNKKRA